MKLESTVDFVYPLREMGNAMLYSPLRFIKRGIGFPVQLSQLLAPNFISSILTKQEIFLLTPETITAIPHILPENRQGVTSERLERVLEKVKSVAGALGITQEIQLYTSTSEEEMEDSTLGARVSLTAIPVFISSRTLNLSDAEVDFIIAHELSHIANNDIIKEIIFSVTVLTIEIIAIFHFSPLAVPFIEGLVKWMEDYLQRRNETVADRSAIAVLGNGEGAAAYFNQSLVQHIEQRRIMEEVFENDRERYFNSGPLFIKLVRKLMHFFSEETIVTVFSSEGNYRNDLRHPPLTVRRDAAMAIL